MSFLVVGRDSRRTLVAALLLSAAATACTGTPDAGSADSAARSTAGDTVLPPVGPTRFTRLPTGYTGVRFTNTLVDSADFNVFKYRNFYNGGGVAIGDLSGDGKPDLLLTANQGGPRLYLNLGNFRFRDVTQAAGLAVPRKWTTGAVLADLNGDGRLDIHVAHAGNGDTTSRRNALWINRGTGTDGVPTFVDEAAARGVADPAYTMHAAVLDFDHDGDLDLFLINNSPKPVNSFGMRNTRTVRDPYGGHKLYRNDGARFTDVSAAAGIFGAEIGFGLGIGVGDMDRDGWPDLYVANDFFERDYLYLNNRDGTFREVLDQQMPVLSYFSMGMDIGDVDNDGWPDVYTTDMLPRDEQRLKTMTSFEGWDVYLRRVKDGYHHQLMRNMLQRNNGDGTFSDVSQYAGVERTDWSWTALIADLDLDGAKDVFVTNGLAKDVTSQDYIAFLANEDTREQLTAGGSVDFLALVKAMSTTPLANYAFRNTGGLRFTNAAAEWGLDAPAISSGAAYGDLDGDGAPDLVVNNVNGEAFVYRNNTRTLSPTHHAVVVQLAGEGANRFGVGARVTAWTGTVPHLQEVSPARGFQSSVDYTLTIGVGTAARVDSLVVEWPLGRVSRLREVPLDRLTVVREAEAANEPARPPVPPAPLLRDVTAQAALGVRHVENEFIDFDRERLIPKLVSTEGPALATGDVNGDGLDDAYLGGAKGQAGTLLLQQRSGRFTRSSAATFLADSASEDVGATFFDADGDGDLDLYVVSGGTEFADLAPALQDRLYLNDGRGQFTWAPADRLPVEFSSGSQVVAADYDGDGDQDLFVGGRVVPWRYGMSPQSFLLQNNGRGTFTDVTPTLAPALQRVGLVTDAVWQDADRDGQLDLVLVGEWMPITIFRNTGGGRLAPQAVRGLEKSHGWWNRIVAADVTGDGRTDFVVGNLGLNARLRASEREPTTMLVKDFIGNGFVEQVVACYNEGKSYPLVLRDDLIKAIPALKARYLNYKDYAGKTMDDIFPATDRAGAVERTAYTFATSLVRANPDGSFTLEPLPMEAQLAPMYALGTADVNADGQLDLLLAGNFDGVKPEIGRMHASFGVTLLGDGRGGFRALPPAQSGFRMTGEGRALARLRTPAGPAFLLARNNDTPLLYRGARMP